MKLKKLWKIKKMCEKTKCVKCEYDSGCTICEARSFFPYSNDFPCRWDLPSLPKKFKGKFILGEKHKIKINKEILKSITKKHRAIKCYVWDDCRTAAAKTWVYGIFMHGTHPYIILNGQKFKHAEPIPREEK